MFGMTPSSFRSAGRPTLLHLVVRECSLGPVLVAAENKGVCARY